MIKAYKRSYQRCQARKLARVGPAPQGNCANVEHARSLFHVEQLLNIMIRNISHPDECPLSDVIKSAQRPQGMRRRNSSDRLSPKDNVREWNYCKLRKPAPLVGFAPNGAWPARPPPAIPRHPGWLSSSFNAVAPMTSRHRQDASGRLKL